MTHRQDIVFSLILVPIRSGLRGFCLFILEIFLMEYRQKNPLKYYVLPENQTSMIYQKKQNVPMRTNNIPATVEINLLFNFRAMSFPK
jgi:hypothetical protein